MFEQIFEEYRGAVDTALKMQQEMYRKWMEGWPVKPPETTGSADPVVLKERIRSYEKAWSQRLAEMLEAQRETLNEVYKCGITAIDSAFRTTEARTPEEYWRLTQEFWRKSIDSYKSAFEAQSKYLQDLSQMWQEMMSKGKV